MSASSGKTKEKSKTKGKGKSKDVKVKVKTGKTKEGKSKDGKSKEGKSKTKFTVPKLTELENQFIMRMPEQYAKNLEEALANGSLKDRLQIDFNEDARNAKVLFDGVTFSAKLLDLPCIIESWKTFDKKSLWKTGDICQILICRDPEDPGFTSEEEEQNTFDYFKKRLHEAKKYQYPHGMTPPLKNVRKRRFRKTAKQKYVDAPEIEKEVKRLLRADISAVDVTFDIVNDEQEKAKQEEPEDEDIDVGGPSIEEQFDENSNMSSMLDGSDIEAKAGQEAEILPDISSSEDDGDDDGPSPSKIKSAEKNNLSKRLECESKLNDVKTKMAQQELRVQNAANPFLKQRFQTVLDQLKEEEQALNAEIASLPS